MKNVKLSYHYCDGMNCKSHIEQIVFKGDKNNKKNIAAFKSFCAVVDGDEQFIASQIGVKDLFFNCAILGIDHSWHTLLTLEECRGKTNDPRSFSEFVKQTKASLPWMEVDRDYDVDDDVELERT